MFRRFLTDDRGLEMSEYAVMAALIVLVLVAAVAALSGAITDAFADTTEVINRR